MNSRDSAKLLENISQERLTCILDEIEAQHQAWRDFMLSLTPKQTVEPVDGPRSALDTLIHTILWIENAVTIALLHADPNVPDPGPTRGPAGYLNINVNHFNAEVIEAHRGMTREEALA